MAGTELHIHVARQQLDVVVDGAIERSYPVSTVLNGVGERSGSGCTPRGAHRVRAKVGAGCAPGTVFVGRRATGEIYSPALAAQHPGRDWILSRILWLTGCTPGVNRGGAVDTLRRENLFKVFSGIALECHRDGRGCFGCAVWARAHTSSRGIQSPDFTPTLRASALPGGLRRCGACQ